MSDVIQSYLILNEPNSRAFVAVGAGHLVGELGIVNLLRQKGWALQKIDR